MFKDTQGTEELQGRISEIRLLKNDLTTNKNLSTNTIVINVNI